MFKYLALFGLLGALLAIYFSDIFYIISPLLNKKKVGKDTLFTIEELATFDGVHQPFLYLAILGNIFNVTKGQKHYGLGQTYNFFVGKDASRNFITGKFEESDASDDIGGLSQQELRSLNNWLKFYRKDYQQVGKLIGRYYDEFGKLTPYARQVKNLIRDAEQAEENDKLEKLKFPPCNLEWDQDRGSRVWCTNKSGGIDRSWVGKPRQYYEPGSKSYRCACIGEENENLGSIKEYPGCDKESDSCFVKQK